MLSSSMQKQRIKQKAYFVGSLSAKVLYKQNYQRIADYLRTRNFHVWDDVNEVEWGEAQKLTDSEVSRYQTKVEKRIRNCDIFVAEISRDSASIGYEIGYAVAQRKPILLMRTDILTSKVGTPFRGNSSKLINVHPYNSENLEHEIEKFLRRAKKGIFVKRVPIEFTSEQVEFIEMLQFENKMSFNANVREVIDDAIRLRKLEEES